MKKRILTLILSLTAMLTCIFGLTACVNKGISFKLNFVVDDTVYATIDTSGDEVIVLPENPTKENYSFDGWFWDKDVWEKPFTANSLLDAPLSSDMSVYAKFSPVHVCSFTEEIANNDYIATNATCENKATYYFSCSCGEKGTETFESGVAQGHSFTNYISDNNATCEVDGTKTAVCNRNGCNEIDTITDVGSKLGHSFTNYISDNNATCEVNGTKTAVCNRNGCNETDTITDVNSKLGHSFTNYISDNNATCEVDGTKTAVCKRNGCNEIDTITDVNSKLGHSFTNYISDNNATYDADGTKTAVCNRNGCNKTDTITDNGSKLQSYFGFNLGYTINNRKAYIKVCSTTKTIYFPDEIVLKGNATYKVYKDIGCENELKGKELVLENVGENKCYILATVNGEDTLYHVTIYLRTKYTVNFITNNNTTIESQVIEEDSLVQKPNDLVKAGYTFNGYDFDFNTPITKNETVTALWTANDNTPYTVEYYLENLENEEYTLTKTENLTGVTDTTAYAEIKTFEHFTAEKQTVSGNINGNGTTVLKVYYQRNEYTVSNAYKSLGSITGAGKYKYGKQITLQSTPILGYNVNWYSGEELLSDSLCYTVTIDKDITAKFTIKPEMANFNFTSTATTCVISGVKNKTITEITVPNYVTSIGSSAFNDCKSLTSITLPFVGASLNGTSNMHFGYIFGASSYSYNDDYVPTSLKEVIITGGSSIGNYAFYNCNSLTSVVIGDGVTSIGDYAFYDCDSLTSVVIGDNVTSIGNSAFSGCGKLVEVINKSDLDIQKNSYGLNALIVHKGESKIVNVNDYLFITVDGANFLVNYIGNDTELKLPQNFNGQDYVIKNYAFYSCNSLTSVEIPDSVTSIGQYAFNSCSSLKSITIGDSVTSIGDYAFSGCTSLTSVEIPDSVTSIGSYAFSGCSSLRSIEIPNSVTRIGDSAFYDCDSLTSIEIPNNVTSIGNYAFNGCSSLTSIEIPDSVTSIGSGAFSGCTSLTKVNYLGTIDEWVQIEFSGSISNPLYYAKNLYINGELVTEVNITTATKINAYAFYNCKSLTSVVIGDSVTSIGSSSFYACSSLKSITLPFVGASLNGTSKMYFGYIFGASSYSYNYDYVPTSLKEVIITGGSNIGSSAFRGCTSLTSIEIPNSVTSIGNNAFYDCDSLTSIEIPDSVTSIGNKAFYDCDSLTSIVIPDSVTSIGDYAFYYCTSLTSIEIPNSVTSIGSSAFYYCNKLISIEIPDSVTSIGNSAFSGCGKLVEVINKSDLDIQKNSYGLNALIVHKGESKIVNVNDYLFITVDGANYLVNYIGNDTELKLPQNFNGQDYVIKNYAFSGCTSLTSIEIPNSVKSIGDYAFSGCSSLTSIVIGDSVKSIGDYAFSGCSSLTSIVIGDSVKSIGDYAFYDCYSLTIYCEATYKPSGWYSDWNYSNCPVVWNCNNNEVAENGYVYTVVDGIRYGLKDGVANIVRQSHNITIASIPIKVTYKGTNYTVTSIGSSAFWGCSSLTSIEIPDSVTSIGSSAFWGCSSLTSIEIPNSVTSIGSSAFSYCDSLTSIEIPNSVTSIGSSAFSYCDSLTSIEIPNSVTSIGYQAFYSCDLLTSIEIPNSVTSIGDYAFYSCDSLTSVVIGKSVTSIGGYAFYGCSKLTSLIFRDTSTWYRTTSSSNWYNKTNGTSTSVTSSSSNATYFKSTYGNYYWYKL